MPAPDHQSILGHFARALPPGDTFSTMSDILARLGSERFLHEIKVTASLQHPNILPLYDSGATDEFLYYVMPYVDGESLRARMRHDGQLSVEDTVTISRSVAAALDYAHEHGIVHRDIEPENVLLQRGQAGVSIEAADQPPILGCSTTG
jgi:eukaryotic-like serine/threonine-protein kinase